MRKVHKWICEKCNMGLGYVPKKCPNPFCEYNFKTYDEFGRSARYS